MSGIDFPDHVDAEKLHAGPFVFFSGFEAPPCRVQARAEAPLYFIAKARIDVVFGLLSKGRRLRHSMTTGVGKIISVVLLCVALAPACKTRSGDKASAKHHEYVGGDEIYAPHVTLLSGQGLRRYIQEVGAKSGADVLKGFQKLEKYEGIKLGAVLLSHSDGIKPTTPAYPRVILFHPKMASVVAFKLISIVFRRKYIECPGKKVIFS